MEMNFFDTMARAQKSYGRLLEPVWKKWNMTRNELDVLLFLANNPEKDRAVDVVNGRGMSKSHVSMSISKLEERGYLCRKDASQDRRTIHLQVTDKAREAVEEGREVQRFFFTMLNQGVTQEEINAIFSFSQRTRKNLELIEKNL